MCEIVQIKFLESFFETKNRKLFPFFFILTFRNMFEEEKRRRLAVLIAAGENLIELGGAYSGEIQNETIERLETERNELIKELNNVKARIAIMDTQQESRSMEALT